MRTFEEVWFTIGNTATHKARSEAQKGWNDCVGDGIEHKLRGTDWYCRGWNACIDEKLKSQDKVHTFVLKWMLDKEFFENLQIRNITINEISIANWGDNLEVELLIPNTIKNLSFLDEYKES